LEEFYGVQSLKEKPGYFGGKDRGTELDLMNPNEHEP
jgi:hypothetical protein